VRDSRIESAIETAKRLGTYGKDDRARQYENQRYNSEALLHNDNLQFQRLRQFERERFRHALILIGCYALLDHGHEIWAFLVGLGK
jgi:hypothetical protein